MPLTLSDAKTYLEIYDTTDVDIEEFIELIFSMDNCYLEYQHEKLEKEREQSERRENRVINGRHIRKNSA